MKAIRDQYCDIGVESYYRRHGGDYENPHFAQIRALIRQNEHRINYSRSLDFCCGSGEVSRVIQELGYPLPIASDPYTGDAYRRQFDATCHPLSFEEVVKNGWPFEASFSSVICSFAMHLCPADLLFPLAYQLFRHTSRLVILTPHKRPALEQYEGISLDFTDYALTEKEKKVYLKAYSFG